VEGVRWREEGGGSKERRRAFRGKFFVGGSPRVF
jgi:hypothetical protein